MYKIILSVMCALTLIGCGGGESSSTSSAQLITLYNIYDERKSDIDPYLPYQPKKYQLDHHQNLSIQYLKGTASSNIPKTYVTQHGLSNFTSPSIGNNEYRVGKNASFDGIQLVYEVGDHQAKDALKLSEAFKKIDVSNLPLMSDQSNPVHQLNRSVEGQILAALLGLGDMEQKFPQGASCWQKTSQKSNQDYIEFYSDDDPPHVDENSAVIKTGQWGNVSWTQFIADENQKQMADVNVNIEGKVYWGFYHPQDEVFPIQPNQFTCDFMNEIAYIAATQRLDKLLTDEKTK